MTDRVVSLFPPDDRLSFCRKGRHWVLSPAFNERKWHGKQCPDCRQAWAKQYREDHKEEIKARRTPYDKQYREDHKEEIKARRASWYRRTLPHRREVEAKYRADHKEERAAYNRQYHADHKEERAAYAADRYAQNKEHILQVNLAWRRANRQRNRDRGQRYYAANKQRIKARTKQYMATPAGKATGRRRNAKRRARLNKAGVGGIGLGFCLLQLERQGGRCYYCKKRISFDVPRGRHNKAELEHVVPLADGGTHDESNVVVSCRSCNARKSSKRVYLI